MALLSRVPVSGVELVNPPLPGSTRASKTAYLDWSYRGLLVAKVNGLTLIGVHLKSPWDGRRTSYESRQSQILGILDYAQTIGGPVLILGDFNDSPGLDATEAAYGLADSLQLLESSFRRAPGEEFTQEDGLNLDHIFLRGGSIGNRHTVETGWSISDHRPVWASVEF